VQQNGSFTAGNVVYTGQFFVDDDINMSVDKVRFHLASLLLEDVSLTRYTQLWPYNTNPLFAIGRGRTRNWRDSLNIFEDMHGNGYQPVFDIHKLGGILQQGLIGYITVVSIHCWGNPACGCAART
jgi:hypothetical protein